MWWSAFLAIERDDPSRMARRCASRLVFLGAFHLASSGCGDASTPPEAVGNATPSAPALDEDSRYLRLRNDTELDLESVLVEDRLEYGALAAGEQSGYLPVDYLYGTALIEAVSGDFRVMYVPVDHVGDMQAAPGYYTYALHPAPVEWRTPDNPDVQWVRIELLEDAAPD
jgi:hypothetical protein